MTDKKETLKAPRKLTSRQTAIKAAHFSEDLKSSDVVVLDLRELCNIADFFVVCSGDSDTQVKAIGDHIQDEMKKIGYPVLHKEGMEWGLWVLLDYGAVIVHVFEKETRKYYDLERLWGDAGIVYGKFPTPEEELEYGE